ncbi:MAG TPA: S53 family peptidase [Gammaproteobacteria bacterium]|nr:S53 family peptidase [Gammaproteobacteria bacterium]
MKTSLILKTALAAALTGIVVASPLAVQAANSTSAVRNNVPAIVGHSHLQGRHDQNSTLALTVSLKLRNTAALASFLRDVQNPYSQQYHHFLTPQQFTEQYGPTQAQVDAVVQFLNRSGIRVKDVSSNRLLIHARGQSSVIEQAMNVVINDYTSADGATFYASATNPTLPAPITASVQSVIGLSNAAVLRPMHRPAVPNKGKPGGGGGTPSGFSPQQIATAYNWPAITSTANGTGATIAVATAYTFKSSDVTGFWSQYGLPNHTVSIISVDGKTHRTDTETTLDIQRSGAMAPGATILVYEAANAQLTTFTDTYNQVVVDNQADVMTTSWGLYESGMSTATLQTDDDIFAQASAQGIALFAAAGDNGSSDGTSNNDTADFPSSDPYVTAAGGTTLTLNSNGTINSETVWSGTGGADSGYFSEPSWENVRNVPQNGHRVTSDLSMDADPQTGYSVLTGGRWSVYGGTSFVAPELAGLFAVRSGQVGRLGQVNALIYQDAGTSNYSTDFFDITSGSNGAFSAGSYWDHPTGWGTPNASNLISHIQ